MSKLIFVSNRLPITVSKQKKELFFESSIGGLATGLKGYHNPDSLWIGWPGIGTEQLKGNEQEMMVKTLNERHFCHPVFLSEKDIIRYYEGFSNQTIWPLFHYFVNKTEYRFRDWVSYQKVNQLFFEAIQPFIEDDTVIWIHDYQLMLLPKLIKDQYPNVKIGFFLHIPFPSHEVFRLLIWRKELLEGILGADLIGFHTYDYVRHFLSSVRRLLGVDHHLYQLAYQDRTVEVDAFPMGIDYQYFANQPLKKSKAIAEKLILSVDRLDYTKGIVERLKAFKRFLEKFPKYHRKVKLHLIVAPSRATLDSYHDLKREIEELVSDINGTYGDFKWMPIWFLYQSFGQSELINFYQQADVLLVTPLRDGMNLVAKEYIASRSDGLGMVVISETAGAASELSEAIMVNANDAEAIALGLKEALDMSASEKKQRNLIMHERIKRYDVTFWATDFLSRLKSIELKKFEQTVLKSDDQPIKSNYINADKRLLLLDYDGTLSDIMPTPSQAKPNAILKKMLNRLASDPNNTVVIVSGRDHQTLNEWLGHLPVTLITDHGLWHKVKDGTWQMSLQVENEWKDSVRHLMQRYADRMPGAFLEEKSHSIVLHYRRAEPEMAKVRLSELKEALIFLKEKTYIEIQQGHMVIEVKDSRVHKGYALQLFQAKDYDFILAAGDDTTDEYMFKLLDDNHYGIKIGEGDTKANFRMKSASQFRQLLGHLLK